MIRERLFGALALALALAATAGVALVASGRTTATPALHPASPDFVGVSTAQAPLAGGYLALSASTDPSE